MLLKSFKRVIKKLKYFIFLDLVMSNKESGDFTRKELEILMKIFVNTNFDDEVDVKTLTKSANVSNGPIFFNIKKYLINNLVLLHQRTIGSTDLFKIDYKALGNVIDNSENYKLFKKYERIRSKFI